MATHSFRLMVTCDDCGLSEGVNHAANSLYNRGMITTVSILPNFRATQHAFHLFKSHAALDVGLHLNLTEGDAITDFGAANALVDAHGRFHSWKTFYRRALFARSSFLSLIETEMIAQMNVFLDASIQPRHLTTHTHFHIIPTLRRLVYTLAQRYKIAWVRNGRLRAAAEPYNILLKRSGLTHHASVHTPDYVMSVKGWLRRDPAQLLRRLESLHGHIELVVHPGFEDDNTFPAGVRYGVAARVRESQYYERVFDLLRTMPESVIITAMETNR